jgi:hypothetical protein
LSASVFVKPSEAEHHQLDGASGGGLWGWIKRLYGFGGGSGDTKTKDSIEDTAKATRGIFDILKNGTSNALATFTGVTASSGGLGGSGRHVGGAASPGASLEDRARAARGGAPIGQGAQGGSFKGGGANASMAKEAYDFWRSKGMDHNAALSMVSQEQGESGFNVRSRGDYVNGNPTAHGIFQWHADRRAAILKATGINVDTADHKQQLEAAYYEGTKGMRAGFLNTLNGRSLSDAVWQGVHRFEGSANQQKDHALRLKMAQGWDGGGSFLAPHGTPTAQAPVPAGSSAKAVTDAEVFAARQRIINGSRDPKDRALVDRYRTEQNTPKAATSASSSPTIDHVARHVLQTIHKAQRLQQHGDKPVPVTYVDRNGTAPSGNPLADLHKWRFDGAMRRAHEHAAALSHMTRMAASANYSTQSVDRSVTSDTRINGGIHVHTAATDARGIAADIEPHLHRGQAAGRADYGIA